MEVIHGLESFPKQRVPVVVVLGTFDGVHLGHQALVRLALTRARETGGRCVVLTFDPHPLQVIAPPGKPFLLTTVPERHQLLADLGVDLCVVVRFDAVFRQIPADRWITMLVESTRLAEAVCGSNYTFGYRRAGNAATLQAAGRDYGFAVHVVPPVEVDGITVSTSEIRALLHKGDVRRAGRLLGRWYGIRGTVIRGDGRGETLGFPTANLAPPTDKVTPALGIYAGFARVPPQEFVRANSWETPGRPAGTGQAAVSVGTRPTFGPGQLLIEAHLIDVSVDLYGAEIDLYFVERLRDELKFDSVEALIRQMHADVEQARAILATPEIR